MKLLFDQGTPVPLRKHLGEHHVDTAAELGWSKLKNGELLDRAESAGYEALLTTDQNLKHQQNLSGRRIAIVVFLSTSWPRIQIRVNAICDAINNLAPGEYVEIRV